MHSPGKISEAKQIEAMKELLPHGEWSAAIPRRVTSILGRMVVGGSTLVEKHSDKLGVMWRLTDAGIAKLKSLDQPQVTHSEEPTSAA